VSAGITLVHTDEARSTAPAISPLYVNPETNLVSANLGWSDIAHLPLDISLFGTNLTNKKYWINQAGAFSQGYESVIVGEPRIYGVRVKYRFGGQ
jgi:iron complex outermembrane receptor protein